MEPREILAGLWHWTASHPKIRIEVSCYWVEHARVLLDPLLPPGDGLAWLGRHGPPEHVILSNRHHWRHCSEIVAAFDCPVWCNHTGLHELEGVDAFGPRSVAVMTVWLREVEDLIAIWLEHQPGQAHGWTAHVPDQHLERLGVSCRQAHLVVDGEARVSPGQEQLQPLLAVHLLPPEEAQHLVTE